MSMRSISVLILFLGCMGSAHLSDPPLPEGKDKEVNFDVNDISYLWPAPKTKLEVDGLISLEEKLADGMSDFLSKEDFDSLIDTAQKVSVEDSAGRENKIDFHEFKDQFFKRSTWKIVAFRIDPSAPGTAPMITKAFGTLPQVRLVAQPVTISETGFVKVHDVTAHLVFNYVLRFDKPLAEGGPPIAVPDNEKFQEILKDLRKLKTFLKSKGVETKGTLTVHPGLNKKTEGFADQVRAFLKKHLSSDRLQAIAFMGLEPPEPWIFFATVKKEGKFVRASNSSLGGGSAQMLTFRGGSHVMPSPKNKNVDGMRGVSTASLFPPGAKDKLDAAIFPDLPGLKHKDIPDLVANPQQAHFFNTDCISCHTESSRRIELKISKEKSEFRYELPAGVSGVDEDVLPKNIWNVRNFGWFQRGMENPVATATMRTANEAAESVDFINRTFLGKIK